jgi:hypothetical protein
MFRSIQLKQKFRSSTFQHLQFARRRSFFSLVSISLLQSQIEYRIEGGVAFASMLGSGLMMLSNVVVKELRQHPYSMIGFLAFCDFWISLKYFATAVYPNRYHLSSCLSFVSDAHARVDISYHTPPHLQFKPQLFAH